MARWRMWWHRLRRHHRHRPVFEQPELCLTCLMCDPWWDELWFGEDKAPG